MTLPRSKNQKANMKKAFDGTKLQAESGLFRRPCHNQCPNTRTFPPSSFFVNEGGHMDVQAPFLSKRDTKHVHFIVNKQNILVCSEESLLRHYLRIHIFLALSVIWLFPFFFC